MESRRERLVRVLFQGMINVRAGPFPGAAVRKHGDGVSDPRPPDPNTRSGEMAGYGTQLLREAGAHQPIPDKLMAGCGCVLRSPGNHTIVRALNKNGFNQLWFQEKAGLLE